LVFPIKDELDENKAGIGWKQILGAGEGRMGALGGVWWGWGKMGKEK